MKKKKQAGVRVATYINQALYMKLLKKADELHTTPSAIIRHYISMQIEGKK